MENDKRGMALIVGADHAYSRDDPYVYHKDAERYDREVEEILLSGSLSELEKMDEELIENAKTDSYWQLLILRGVLKKIPRENLLTVYGRPTYFSIVIFLKEDWNYSINLTQGF